MNDNKSEKYRSEILDVEKNYVTYHSIFIIYYM